MRRVELHHGAATDTGLVREVNEDAHLASPPVYVIADGMGGHDGGDAASAIVVEEFARLVEQRLDEAGASEALRSTLGECQRRIEDYGRQQDVPAEGQAGTTVVAAVLVDHEEGPRWLIVNVGDSRAYRVAGDDIEQVTVDHSLVQELVDHGAISPAEASTHPERHVITRSLGGTGRPDADVFTVPLAHAERLVLCSDGVSDLVADGDLRSILRESPDPRDAADRLVAAALEAGGRDNATAVVVDVVGWSTDKTYDSERQRESLEQKLGTPP